MVRSATDGKGSNVAAPAPAGTEVNFDANPAPFPTSSQMSALPDVALDGTTSATILPERRELPLPTRASQPNPPTSARFAAVSPNSGGAGRRFDPYAPLAAFARERKLLDNGMRQSALLVDPASLKAKRAQCKGGQQTVLLDLDPVAGLIDPQAAREADPLLVRHLANLRRGDVAIAWISGQSADSAGDVRELLAQSGLDPERHDELILMRYRDDRKQTRRADLAERACVIAIAGDARSDFDELFDYIVDPVSALELEPVFDNGWFLIPPIFTAERQPS